MQGNTPVIWVKKRPQRSRHGPRMARIPPIVRCNARRRLYTTFVHTGVPFDRGWRFASIGGRRRPLQAGQARDGWVMVRAGAGPASGTQRTPVQHVWVSSAGLHVRRVQRGLKAAQRLAPRDDVVVAPLALKAEQFDQKAHRLRRSQVFGQIGTLCQHPGRQPCPVACITRALETGFEPADPLRKERVGRTPRQIIQAPRR
ncbi:hypothetical protein Veis_2453 [Verminephrobacter eiseniae EF01-2]|uniref:Uncharacterized protein n=1 Tax=Verminephrobacter eiseniae (strain EF01-2) TaxID=391735 RepID=A1WKP1_VEREI|nr:hypothetical protein Veis_2453 [Verminephrobacter eiseniae EF01-2]